MSDGVLHGLLAEFADPDRLVLAVEQVRAEGYRDVDAFSPYPVEGLVEALGARRPWVPVAMLVGGPLGAAAGYAMQYYMNAVDYPLNVGGRPLHSWPAFVPITFELGILGAALAGVIAMFVLARLPMPHHPLFDVSAFDRATRDRFFLLIGASDREFEYRRTRRFLQDLQPEAVHDVFD